MKRCVSLNICLVASLAMTAGCSDGDNFPRLEGPYFGQEPPGVTPEVFAPGTEAEAAAFYRSIVTAKRARIMLIFNQESD